MCFVSGALSVLLALLTPAHAMTKAAKVYAAAASAPVTLPTYTPTPFVIPTAAGYLNAEGAIMVVGYNDMRDMLVTLTTLFTKAHPAAKFALDLRGTRFAPDALARGHSAFAPMGAAFTPKQLADYRTVSDAPLIAFRVAHASLNPKALSGPLGIFVHADNPLAMLDMTDVADIFSGRKNRWGELGLRGAWEDREIHVLGMAAGTALADFFQTAALGARQPSPALLGVAQSADVVKLVAGDPMAIGYAAVNRADSGNGRVRVLPLAASVGAFAAAPTQDNVQAGKYPLDRFLLIYAQLPVSPLVREFMRLVLSREGQDAIAKAPQAYLPLNVEEALREREKLN